MSISLINEIKLGKKRSFFTKFISDLLGIPQCCSLWSFFCTYCDGYQCFLGSILRDFVPQFVVFLRFAFLCSASLEG